MPWRRYVLVAIAVLATACAEIEFGVGAGGSQAGGAGGGGSVPTGGDGPTGEQCLNGDDDDADGLVDCEDDDCGAFSCVELPAGWIGPVELRADDSPCEGVFSAGIASLKTAVDAPDAVCSCACSGSLQTCETADLSLFTTANCDGSSNGEGLVSGDCSAIQFGLGIESYRATPDISGGSCSTSVDEVLPPVTFDARRLCGPASEPAGCDTGTCAPASTCVYMPGEVECPSGYTTSFVGNVGLVDSRGCAAGSCACGAATNGCTFLLEVFGGENCNGAALNATTSTACNSFVFGLDDKSVLYTGTAGLTSCPPTGSPSAIGGVSVSDPITVCCLRK